MKFKIIIVIQILLLLAVMTFGSILEGDLTSDARSLHRIGSMLSTLAALVTVIVAIKTKMSKAVVVLSITSFISVLLAGYFGSEISGAADYSQMFNLMRTFGIVALVSSVAVAIVSHKQRSN